MSNGQKLWIRANKVIPGGNMLLSKRPDRFLPAGWPTYFTRAKGCEVWDLDNKRYIDMCLMGVGTNILGYGNPEVDSAVRAVIDSGNMSTLNCPEDVHLAERLIELHSWADMARFARTGGEANAIAIRIARAASGKDKVAVCGYHGWHDWYLSANLDNNDKLTDHLLPGLEPKGVPAGLRGTVLPFHYNNISELESLMAKHPDVGTIKMEVARNQEIASDFLKDVRKIATSHGIILIFDECTSGFRQAFGGLHKYFGVEPDMAIFGKALGNGYAMTGVIGRREVMEHAESTFISSTFWTERIGPVAALKTLDTMEKTRSWELITKTGNDIKLGWQKLARKHDLKIEQWGIPALAGFNFCSCNNQVYKTFLTQEMLKRNYLASNAIYVCTEHDSSVVNQYLELLDSIFGRIRECEDGRSAAALLDGPVSRGGFGRLN